MKLSSWFWKWMIYRGDERILVCSLEYYPKSSSELTLWPRRYSSNPSLIPVNLFAERLDLSFWFVAVKRRVFSWCPRLRIADTSVVFYSRPLPALCLSDREVFVVLQNSQWEENENQPVDRLTFTDASKDCFWEIRVGAQVEDTDVPSNSWLKTEHDLFTYFTKASFIGAIWFVRILGITLLREHFVEILFQ